MIRVFLSKALGMVVSFVDGSVFARVGRAGWRWFTEFPTRDAVPDDAEETPSCQTNCLSALFEIGTRAPFLDLAYCGSRSADHGRKLHPGAGHRPVAKAIGKALLKQRS